MNENDKTLNTEKFAINHEIKENIQSKDNKKPNLKK